MEFTVDDCNLDGSWTLAGEIKDFHQQEWLMPLASAWDIFFHRWKSVPIDYANMEFNLSDFQWISTEQASILPATGVGHGETFANSLDIAIDEGWHIRRPVTHPMYRPRGKAIDLD